MDELVTVRESICLGPFQTKIIEGWVKPLLGDMAHVMIMPLKAAESQPWEARPLPPGLHILNAYTHLKNGSSRVSLMVRNMSNSHIFLKKGVPLVHVISASLVPPTELSPEMEAALGMEAKPEPLSVMARQEKLLEKLNLDRLAHCANSHFCVLLFAGFLVSSCQKRVLIWGNCHEKLRVEIFVRVLCSSEVISLILCK